MPIVTDVWGVQVEPFYTHGYNITARTDMDLYLQKLVIRCMADQPAHRPTLEELKQFVDGAERDPDWQNDEYERDWFRFIFNEPPRVRTFLSFPYAY